MTQFAISVMGQTRFVCAVHEFIQDLLLKTVPDLLEGSPALKTSKAFGKVLDNAIALVSSPTVTARDCNRAIVEAAGAEMKTLCHLLRVAAEVTGLGEIAERYLDGARFQEMLLRKDEDKLERLNDILRKASVGPAKPAKILMDVANVLDENAECYDDLDAAAKRKAQRDIARLMGKVEEIHNEMTANKNEITQHIDEGKDEIVSHVDAVGAKVDKLKFKGKRKSKYNDAQREACIACWIAAQKNTGLKYASSKGVTHEAAFEFYRRELAAKNVTSAKQFIAILNAIKSKACEARKRELDAKREAERKAKKCGTIRGMKGIARAVMAVALGAFGAAFGAALPQLPEPVHADTEVWTNVPCSELISDVRELDVALDFTGTASNCVQVAFGRDADADGDLSRDETDLALGWRAGDWFVEDVRTGRRFRESAEFCGQGRRLSFRVAAGKDGAKSAGVVCDGAAKFGEALGGDLRWLYGADWNLLKVTRRGVDSPGEIVLVASDHGGMRFIVR